MVPGNTPGTPLDVAGQVTRCTAVNEDATGHFHHFVGGSGVHAHAPGCYTCCDGHTDRWYTGRAVGAQAEILVVEGADIVHSGVGGGIAVEVPSRTTAYGHPHGTVVIPVAHGSRVLVYNEAGSRSTADRNALSGAHAGYKNSHLGIGRKGSHAHIEHSIGSGHEGWVAADAQLRHGGQGSGETKHCDRKP